MEKHVPKHAKKGFQNKVNGMFTMSELNNSEFKSEKSFNDSFIISLADSLLLSDTEKEIDWLFTELNAYLTNLK